MHKVNCITVVLNKKMGQLPRKTFNRPRNEMKVYWFVMFDSEGDMAKLSKCRFNLEKIRMDYSCHAMYKGIHIVFSGFPLLSSWKNRL